jgi:hypothetical protein
MWGEEERKVGMGGCRRRREGIESNILHFTTPRSHSARRRSPADARPRRGDKQRRRRVFIAMNVGFFVVV